MVLVEVEDQCTIGIFSVIAHMFKLERWYTSLTEEYLLHLNVII